MSNGQAPGHAKVSISFPTEPRSAHTIAGEVSVLVR